MDTRKEKIDTLRKLLRCEVKLVELLPVEVGIIIGLEGTIFCNKNTGKSLTETEKRMIFETLSLERNTKINVIFKTN